MTTTTAPSYTDEQISAWLRGLLTLAWADGHYDEEEQELIAALTQSELAPQTDLGTLETISTDELVAALGHNTIVGENFLRTAVMVAVADGVYSSSEDKVLREFCQALGLEVAALESLRSTLYDREAETEEAQTAEPLAAAGAVGLRPPEKPAVDVLAPMRHWLDGMEMHDPRVARFLCKMIPPQCPFERDVKVFGRKVIHIPPLCKLNPLYEQLVGIRFRALSYLADDCKEDISPYI